MPSRGTPGAVLVAAGGLAVVAQSYGLYRPEDPSQPGWLPYVDKIGHLLGFAVPVALVLLAIGAVRGSSRTVTVVVVAVFAGQAMLSEVIQATLIPGRSGDVADLAADAVGIGLGVLVAWALRPVVAGVDRDGARP